MSERSLLARRAGLVALGTLASRVLGLVRQAVMAALFPVASTDAFVIAFTIPNTLRMLLGEGAVSNAFMPIFAEVRTREGETGARRFVAHFSGALGLLLVGATIAGILLAPLFGLAYAGGFLDEPERFALVVSLTRWLFPVLAFVGLTALATGVLNALGRFAAPAFAPALQNVGMIVGPLLLSAPLMRAGVEPIFALAYGALAGALLSLLVQLPALRRAGMLPRPRLALGDPDVRRALALMGPLVLSLGVYQLNMMLSRLFTSFLPAGAASYLDYGNRVIEIPQGMFAIAVASAAAPTLSRLRSEGKEQELLALFRDALRLTLFIALPATAALFALSEPVAAVLYGRGAFLPHDVAETGRSLAVQGLAVWAVACIRVVSPMFAAHKDTRTLLLGSVLNLVTFLLFSALLLRVFGHVAIAIANGVAAVLQLSLYLYRLRRRIGPLGLRPVVSSGARVGVASLVLGLTGWAASRALPWTAEGGELLRVAQLSLVLGVALALFLAAALALRVPELGELWRTVRRRANRAT
jgi:putative peptidoglycan lipid II flippase